MADPGSLSMWHQGCFSGQRLGLSDEHLAEWSDYLVVLTNSHIRLSIQEDLMFWYHHSSGEYTPKNGYIQLKLEAQNRPIIWWWKKLWKLKCPAKEKLICWSILENKAPTWDVL